MYARSTTITTPPAAIDRGITFVQDEVMPQLLALPGCVGLSLLVDHSTGRCITTSSWHDEAAMRATTETVKPLRDRFLAEIGGSAPMIDEWEIALMHRDHRSIAGARARVSWLKNDPKAADGSVEAFRGILPTLDELPGFCSASLLIDRATGRAVSTVIYDSAKTLVQTRARANELRKTVSTQTGAEVLEVAEFELALAHLRVPEMA